MLTDYIIIYFTIWSHVCFVIYITPALLLFSFLCCHVCCMKLTTDVSSTTGPLYQNIPPVSNVTKTSNFEMKDNQAYGVVTTPTISTPPV